MKSLLLAVLAAYVVSAIHSVLAFVNKRRALQRVSDWAMAIGFVLHTTALAADWFIDGHYPLFSFPETLSFLAWTMVVGYALVRYRYGAHALGTFTLPEVSFLVFLALLIGSPITPQGVGFSDTWLFPVHTTLLLFAYAAFFAVFVASVMYLLQERELKLKTFTAIFHRLPSLTTLNEIATSAAAIGLALLTLGIATGMLWSSSRYGVLWHNDPKEIFALLTWLLYLLLIVYRSTAHWRGRSAAWLGVAGFVLVLCTLFGARWMGGYHVFG
ncbi:MAG TPA: cytochrome c biogenesis protein CcsA [Pyrinomonadaceae bacterium]|jgi:ABC-type transport system involved in cytochrome c biogenesis permease subunit|nr:cytochrome c biogenesis protein CcsA [Pyrinomonadaceae bacterium]HET9789498.1 cytochrome c biogenesis protein CcsA [Pyrinomonadaceae bacterium]HZI85302.1 cytochrome c biogenesis protein CcsA [Pyrinomonadaceae bacterium]